MKRAFFPYTPSILFASVCHLVHPCVFNLGCLFTQAPTPQQREMMEEAAARIAQDNCELACCFIQKTAVEKAGPEMDKRLATVRLQKNT